MSTTANLPLHDIQGDILIGLPKKTETWYFFQITDAAKFKKDLVRFIPLVKTAKQAQKDRDDIAKHKRNRDPSKPALLPMVGVGVAFSHAAFTNKLGIPDDNLKDGAYLAGQRADAKALQDKGVDGPDGTFIPDWEEPFKKEIHGVFIIAAESRKTADKKLKEIEAIFGEGTDKASIEEVTSIIGDVRPGPEDGHEHFGYLDGISNPAVKGFDTNVPPGPAPVNPGIILLGQQDDKFQSDREDWMKNGSFCTFRYLFQLVPEFDDFVDRNAIEGMGLSHQQGADLLGARLVGRWKSGAPIDIANLKDDPALGADAQRNNNFFYTGENQLQAKCPFAAHVRKTNPRGDLEASGSIAKNRIIRRGIPFGPEVSKEERESKKTSQGRGLLFACYSSSIDDGFKFLQTAWANNAGFPFTAPADQVPGLDPIIGQGDRKLSGTDPADPTEELALDAEWVVPRGGEYFFTPSITGLKRIAA